MSCGYCQATPVVDFCPVCQVNMTQTPRRMRAADVKPKAPSAQFMARHQAEVDRRNAHTEKMKVDYAAGLQAQIDAERAKRNAYVASLGARGIKVPVVSLINHTERTEEKAYKAPETQSASKPRSFPVPPPIVRKNPVSARVGSLSVCCDLCEKTHQVDGSVPTGMVRMASGKLECVACSTKPRPIPGNDWHLAAMYAAEMFRKPAQLGDGKAPEVSTWNSTMPPISRGDWAGLGRAVEAGILTHAKAVELAQQWTVSA